MQVYFLNSDESYAVAKAFDYLYERSQKLLTELIGAVDLLKSRGGHPQPPMAKPLRDVDPALCEITRKYPGDQQLRVFYFVTDDKEKLILLNYFVKPDGRKRNNEYSGKRKSDIAKAQQDAILLAKKLKDSYLLDQSNYEQLNF